MPQILVTPLQLSHTLQSARKSRHLSQAQLAKHLGLSQSRMSKLEQDTAGVTVEQLLALCSALGLELVVQERGGAGAPSAEW